MGNGLIDFRILFLKIDFRILFLITLKLTTLRMLWSRLFCSITAKGKKRIFEKMVFFKKRGMFSITSGVRRS